MASSGKFSHSGKRLKVFTFEIRGGQSVSLRFHQISGPPLIHDGSFTLWKMVGTSTLATDVEDLLIGPLVGATVKVYTEEQTEEQAAERRARLGR